MFREHLEVMVKTIIHSTGRRFAITSRLAYLRDGFQRGHEYEIMLVPNIVNITYGRGVGYSFEEEVFDSSVTEISATKIRQKLREEGKLD
jgi:hypothetical protein